MTKKNKLTESFLQLRNNIEKLSMEFRTKKTILDEIEKIE
jgi:hypothetical protein